MEFYSNIANCGAYLTGGHISLEKISYRRSYLWDGMSYG